MLPMQTSTNLTYHLLKLSTEVQLSNARKLGFLSTKQGLPVSICLYPMDEIKQRGALQCSRSDLQVQNLSCENKQWNKLKRRDKAKSVSKKR